MAHSRDPRLCSLSPSASPAGARSAAACSAVALLLLGGCVGPLGSRESDRGDKVSLDRLRTSAPLQLDAFKTTDAAAAASVPTIDETNPPPKPPSRFEGLERVELTIEQCRAEALRNNLDLKVALVDPTIADEGLRVELAKFEAVFTPFARYSNADRPTLQTTVANQQKNTQFGAGVDIPLRTGGRASIDFTESRQETPNNPFFQSSSAWSSDLTMSISQPLLRNGWEEANTASIRIAGFQQQIAEARTKLTVVAQLAAVDRAYWRLYAAGRELEVRQQQYELAASQLAQAQRRVRAGDTAEIDVVRAQSGLASRLESIIIAENNVLNLQRELKRVVNMPDLAVDSVQLVTTATKPAPAQYALDSEVLTQAALSGRMELLETELQLLADAADEGLRYNQLLPQLDISGSYTFSGLASNFNANNRVLANGDFQSFSAGLQGEIPLGNEAAEARYRRSILIRLQRVSTKQARELTVKQDVLNAIDNIRGGWQRILAAQQSTILAARTLRGEQRQFDVGQRTSTDVLDAAARLADSQSAEIRALTDYQIAQVDLAIATGTVLGSGRVFWEPTTTQPSDLPRGAKLWGAEPGRIP